MTRCSQLAVMLAALALGGCSSGEDAPRPVRTVSQQEIAGLVGAGKATLLDVRSVGEYESGHVPGAINIPIDQLAGRLDELAEARKGEVIVYCEKGGRAGTAADLLAEAGFEHLGHLEGDMSAWRDAELDVER